MISRREFVKNTAMTGVGLSLAFCLPEILSGPMARFGARLTEAFHSDITTLLGPGMQSLGTRVFLDASRALDEAGSPEIVETHAMLSLEFLKPN